MSVAFRSDCSKQRPWLVLVVAKKVRAEHWIPSGLAWRAGLDIRWLKRVPQEGQITSGGRTHSNS